MFDKLIVSEPNGANINNRKGYFVVTSLSVGIIFVAALVASIFAANFDIGNEGFEYVILMPPLEMAAPAAVEPKIQPKPRSEPAASKPKVAIRQVNMERVDEARVIPSSVSTVQNTERARPQGKFVIGKLDVDPVSSGTTGRETSGATGTGLTGTGTAPAGPPEPVAPPPPPAPKPPVVTKAPIKTLGVINGKATSLPKPNYPAAAKAVNAHGTVNIQVMIDESGKVVSARAVSGHPLLRAAAEEAARNARFSPTLLSNVPVKVTGVITYNFIRS